MLAPVRFSDLKYIGRSALHYRTHLDKGDKVSASAERSMRFGSAAHALILEPERADIVVFTGATRRGKAWDVFKVEHAGKLILKQSEYDSARRLADAVLANEAARPWLVGVKEAELATWEFAGRTCGGRPDVRGHDFISDVKTTADVSPAWFVRAALRMAYHGQMAWYLRGASAMERRAYERAALIAVEQKPPHDVVVYPFTPRALEAGDRICHAWMERLLSSERSGKWPGISAAEVPLDVAEDVEFDFSEDESEEPSDE